MNDTKNIKDLTCWIITEGMIGTQNQCVGVAEALGVEAKIIQISIHQPWRSLSPWLGHEKGFIFKPALTPPWPDLLIAAGRKSIAASRFIKKQSKGKTYTVQLQDPKISPEHFDLVAVPFHDKCRGENVLVTNGAPNRITEEKLEEARDQFAELLGAFSALPRAAVLIGGNSKTHKITPEIMRKLAKQLYDLEANLMITTSRRTGEANIKILKEVLADRPENNGTTYIWDNEGENPYFGMLAWADHIIVTADSVSMVSDAGTAGKPVRLIPLEGSSSRFDRLHGHMEEIGVLMGFNGNLRPWTYEPLTDAMKIADKIRAELGITS